MMAGFILSIFLWAERYYYILWMGYNILDSFFRGIFYSITFKPVRMDGKTVVITGSNVGIGYETAKFLYRQGARVIMACRNVDKTQAAIKRIEKAFHEQPDCGKLVLKPLDVSSMDSVRKFAEDVLNTEKHIHVLINNAGTIEREKTLTEDGFEKTFATNHLGPFLLTLLLSPKLIASAPSRIVNLASIAWRGTPQINWDDLNYDKRPFDGMYAYGRSKQAQVYFTVELARRLKGKNVTAYSLHPGIVLTQMIFGYAFENMKRPFFIPSFIYKAIFSIFKTPEEGTATTLFCVFKDEENDSGSYFNECWSQGDLNSPEMRKRAEETWYKSCKLVNIDSPPF